MRRAVLAAMATVLGCGGPKLQERSVSDVSASLPATLEVERPREGDARTVKIRVWVDATMRAQPRWREEIGDQIDYASQLLTPLAGVRLAIEGYQDWDRTGEPHEALRQLAAVDPGDGATWVIGYIAPRDAATTVLGELGFGEPLGRHVVVRGWAGRPEALGLAETLAELKKAERVEVLGAHRRHKQAVVLLRAIAATLGAIAETDPAWIQHPTYSPKQTGFSERNRELITLALDARQAEETDPVVAKKLLEAIEKAAWGGWVQSDQEQVTKHMRNILDAAKAGKTASEVPAAAYDQFSRIKTLAQQGKVEDALAELANLLTAYPGNAAMHQLRCEIMLGAA
ncbi:MAG: hypothetical protein M3680_29595, partial [Myxococcota bacterium]|nr:hypothetical protein [Myxococcota bacterium]